MGVGEHRGGSWVFWEGKAKMVRPRRKEERESLPELARP